MKALAANDCLTITQKTFVGFVADVFNDSYHGYLLSEYVGAPLALNEVAAIDATSPNTYSKDIYEVTSAFRIQLENGRASIKNGVTVSETADGWAIKLRCK
jgi:hypothetical protein